MTRGFGAAMFVATFVALLPVSCVHEVEVARPGAKGRRPASAVNSVMALETENATDLGDGDLVGKALREKLVRNANDLEARLALAGHYKQRGSPELALDHYAMAAKRFPDDTRVPVLAAQTLHEMGDNDEAAALLLAFWKSHVKTTPATLLSELGIVDDDLGKFADAEYAYRAALTIAPKAAPIHNNLGYNLLLQGKCQGAAAEFRRALSIEPHSEIARDNLGVALAGFAKDAAKGTSKDARKEALLNFESVSGPATAHNNLAAILIEQGRYGDARKELDLALSYQKDFAPALDNLRLVSELDGKPATISQVPVRVTPLKRFALSLGRALAGTRAPEATTGKAKDETAHAASRTPEE